MARETVELYNYNDIADSSQLVAAIKKLRQDFDFHNHDGVNSKSFDNVTARSLLASGQIIGSSIYVPSISNPLFYISKEGVLTAVAGKYLEEFTSGEAINNGDIVCLSPSYTDYIVSDDAYVNQQQPDTNFGSEISIECYATGGTTNKFPFFKWDLTTIPLPENILKAELRLRVKRKTAVSGTNPQVRRISSANWGETTITWNNKPTASSDFIYQLPIPNIGDWAVVDITQLVRQWKGGNINNFGFTLSMFAGDDYSFYAKEDDVPANRPRLRIWSIDTSDGKIYKANCANYLLCRSILGIAQQTVAANKPIKIQTHGQITNIDFGNATGSFVYLNNVAGGYTLKTNNLNRVIKVAKITGAKKSIIDIQSFDILIEKTGGPLPNDKLYPPSDARYAVIKATYQNTGRSIMARVCRDADGISNSGTLEIDQANAFSFSWSSNYITLTLGTNVNLNDIAFYS